VTTTWVPQAQRTHCPQGHPLAGDNLVESQLKRGRRKCLTCHRAQALRQAHAIRVARKVLGYTWQQYIDEYGYSLAVAEQVVRGHYSAETVIGLIRRTENAEQTPTESGDSWQVEDEFGYALAVAEEATHGTPVGEPLPIQLADGSYIEPARHDHHEEN
jgi:hypothetical protein